MRHRISWITFWTILTFWLGGSWGCAGPAPQHSWYGTRRPMAWTMAPTSQPFSETYASLVGLDRSGWEHVVVSPDPGETVHGPLYFLDYWWQPTYDPPAVMDVVALRQTGDSRVSWRPATTEEQMLYSLRGASAQNWSAANALDLGSQVGGFYVDIGLLPVHMCLQAPWSQDMTP